jgi:tetratricopeptide (TPR) repeat protein
VKRALLVCALLCACAPTLPAAYVRARDAAENDYGNAQFEAAATSWLEAAEAAGSPRDRSEARYRAATSYERAGQLEKARQLYELLARGKSERAPRATFALADLRLRSGDKAGGYAALEAAVRKYPTSGVAALSLRRYFAELAERGGDEAVLAYIARAEPALDRTELSEQLLYERARRLDALGKVTEARDAYLVVADRFPYPYGAYWDDALFHGSECEQRLGNPTRAVELLKRMLVEREASHMSGSYERPRFADAAYRIAELYRDGIHDPVRARRAFHDVFVDFPSSTLRDDALWQEALLARHSSEAEACAPLSLLVKELPDSRYAPCASEICPNLRLPIARECKDYIRHELEAEPDSKQESTE